MPEPDSSKMLKVGELAVIADVSKMTIYRLIYTEKLPATRIGRAFRVKRADWDAYLEGAKHRTPDAS